MPLPPSPGPFYTAAAAFRTRCLATDDSLFTPGRPIWTAATAEDLYVRFVETPDVRTGVGFIAKLEGQLEGAQPATVQFAAEAVFVHLLGEADTSASTKRTHVSTMMSWYPGNLAIPNDLDAALADGIANVGVAKSRRDYQLNFLLEFVRTWKHLDEEERDRCLEDPRAFSHLVRSLPPHSASTEIDGLLHKAFPETFEAIFSGNVKRRIIAAFEKAPGVVGESDIDVALERLRGMIEPAVGRPEHFFYAPLIEPIWKSSDPGWDDFVGWAGRLFGWDGFDAQERAYKLEIADRIEAARAAFLAGAEWPEPLAEAVSRGGQNLVPWQTRDDFMAWARREPDTAASLVGTIWNDEGPNLTAFAELAPGDVLSTLSARLAIATFLLIGVDRTRYVIYRPRVYAKAAELVGHPVSTESGEDQAVYDGFLTFLDTLRLRLLAQGIPTRDRMDAQGLVWWLGGEEPPPTDWCEDDRRRFIAYRRDQPDPPSGDVPEKAWFMRGTVNGRSLVPDWVVGGFVSVGWDEIGDIAPEDIGGPDLRELLAAIRPNESPGAALGNLSRFIRLMAPGHVVVAVDGDDLFVGRVASAVTWEPDAPQGERRRRDVEWLNADEPLKRSRLRESAPRLYSRLRTLLTITDLAEDVDTVAALVGLMEIVVEPTLEAALPPATDELADSIFLTRQWLDEVLTLLRAKRQVIFYGPPGTGKTYVAQALAAHVVESGGNSELVQFHPSYAYEDFFEGYRPTGSGEAGGMAFELRPGPLRRLAADAEADPSRPYLLVVDEINRGNLAKVFGELYFLLEYRDHGIALQYSPEVEFRLPRNLFIIGTMNTADRSIALVDSALRRRFYFVPFSPTEPPLDRVLPGWLAAHGLDPEPGDLLAELNRALAQEPGIGDEFAIGPSYLMTGNGSAPRLDHAWRYAILPLLEERFFGVRDRAEVEREFGLAAIRRRLQPAVETAGEDADDPGD